MSDIRFNRWLHQSGTGGVYQDSAGNIGIGTSVPTTALDVQGGNLKIGSNTLSSSGVSTFTTINATTVSATSLVGVSTAGITTAYITSINNGPISGSRNRIINGDMRIDQRNGGASVTANAGTAFSCDRWRSYLNGTGTLTFTQSSVVPNGNFTNSILITVTGTGSPTESACSQTIEGFNISDFGFGTANAIPLTASFWVRSSVTGTYFFSLRQGSGSRSFVSPFTISTANTWQQVTVSIPGDTSGTYNTTNGAGFIFQICVGATSLQTSTINAWQSGNYVCTSAQTNLASTNGATFYITGVQLEPGTVATPFERRSYGDELQKCLRYFQKSYNATDVPGTATSNGTEWLTLPTSGRIAMTTRLRVPMRANCTVKLYDWAGNIDRVRTSGGNNQTTFTIQVANETAFTVDTTSTSVTELLYQYTATAEL